MDWEETYILQQLRQKQKRLEMAARFGGQQQEEAKTVTTHEFANASEARLIASLRAKGYDVLRMHIHHTFDLWVNGLRVEVKASTWQSGRRYQAHIRNHEADLVVFMAVNGEDHHFFIPMHVIKPRKTIEVGVYNVKHYTGIWARYFERWDVLRQAVYAAPARPKQLKLNEV